MANFRFKSNYQKRFENGKLISVSYSAYDFQNIPLGPGDEDSLDNIVVKVLIQGIVSFDVMKKEIDNDKYFFKDRSECIDVIYYFDKNEKKINSIEFIRHDINIRLVFLESDINENVYKELVVDNVSTSEEMRNVYPERIFSDDKLEDEIDTFENRVETTQEYLTDEDDPTVRGVLASRLSVYRQALRQLLAEKQRRRL
ncbi:hypothetical protein [Prevotella sp.]|uniref:hypothetical protein n=1 Tax=Prevotella sp. TaxID=59823 RepID=UPI003AB1B1D1